MLEHGNWHYPTEMRFGVGRIVELPSVCAELGMARPLLVTDPGLRDQPMVAEALGSLTAAGMAGACFADVQANPTGRNVEAGVAAFREQGCDGVIAFGGGSALDAGKAIALMAGQRRPIWDFEDREDWYRRVDTDGMAATIAVPTTAGTGSEVGRAAVILDEDNAVKKIIFHPRMLPVVVIADPALTVGLPPRLTAATGMDALAHSLEAFCAPRFHPMADGIALEGMRLVKRWLTTAVAEGGNLEARAGMLAAASMGATAFQKGLGAIHALSHPLGAVHGTHHGETNAVLMPYVLAFNRPAIAGRMVQLARYLELPQADFDGVMEWVLALRREIGIPQTLTDLGVGEGAVDRLVPMALQDPSMAGNPRPMVAGEVREVLLTAMR